MYGFYVNMGVRCFLMIRYSLVSLIHNSFTLFISGTDTGDTLQPSTYLFSRQSVDNNTYINLFSVPSPNLRLLKSRAFVTHQGTDTGDSLWSCSKDTATNCAHITTARNWLQKLVQADPHAQDNSINPTAPLDYRGTLYCSCRSYITSFKLVPHVRGATLGDRAVSHIAIPPPFWASLPTDSYIRHPIQAATIPNFIPIAEGSSCSCGATYIAGSPTYHHPCTVYTLLSSHASIIEVQKCMSCCHRFVGPDCGTLGLFNFNNRILFTHDLLDEYTSSFTTSETPFIAFVTVVTRRYQSRLSGARFVSEQMFRAVWFAYVKIQQLEGDMECPCCGDSPENTIWDGVTLAFHRKHLLPSLKPPTTICNNAIIRTKTRYIANQQLLQDAKLRKMVRTILVGQSLIRKESEIATSACETQTTNCDEDEEDLTDSGDDLVDQSTGNDRVQGVLGNRQLQSAKRVQANALARVEAIPLACEGLRNVHTGLGDLFSMHFGLLALGNKTWGTEVYRRLFLQVCLTLK